MQAIAPLTRDAATERQRALYDAVEKRFGAVLAPVAVAAHSEPVLDAMVAFERAFARADRLPPRLAHLVNLYVAALLGCPFCVDIGSHLALGGGATPEQLADLPRFRESPHFDAAEATALAVAEAMTTGDGELDASLWPALRSHFDDAALVELFAIVAWENFRSRFNKAAGLEAQGFCPIASRAPVPGRAGSAG